MLICRHIVTKWPVVLTTVYCLQVFQQLQLTSINNTQSTPTQYPIEQSPMAAHYFTCYSAFQDNTLQLSNNDCPWQSPTMNSRPQHTAPFFYRTPLASTNYWHRSSQSTACNFNFLSTDTLCLRARRGMNRWSREETCTQNTGCKTWREDFPRKT
jgi:hypothetical protein